MHFSLYSIFILLLYYSQTRILTFENMFQKYQFISKISVHIFLETNIENFLNEYDIGFPFFHVDRISFFQQALESFDKFQKIN